MLVGIEKSSNAFLFWSLSSGLPGHSTHIACISTDIDITSKKKKKKKGSLSRNSDAKTCTVRWELEGEVRSQGLLCGTFLKTPDRIETILIRVLSLNRQL